MNDKEFLKSVIIGLEAKYVNEVEDGIKFTYEDRNYTLYINRDYNLVTLEGTNSIKSSEMDANTLELLRLLRMVLSYTEYEDFKIIYSSYYEKVTSIFGIDFLSRAFEITNPNDNDKIIRLSKNEIRESIPGKISNYMSYLKSFDKRLFDDDFLEDYRNKIYTYSEKDIFLIINTLSAYFYNICKKTWEDIIIDPFVINDFLECAIDRTKFYSSNFDNWYNKWNDYFSKNNVEDYLNGKDKRKQKS